MLFRSLAILHKCLVIFLRLKFLIKFCIKLNIIDDGIFLLITCLSCSSSFFINSSSALRYAISASFLARISSTVKSLLSVLPEFNVLVSSKPKTPLSLYAALHLKLADSMRLIPITSTSNPASSKIFLEVFPFSYSAINCNLNSLVYFIF